MAHMFGQCSLALGREQAFGGKRLLEHFETAAQRAIASFFHGLGDQLIVAAPLVQAQAPAHQHLHAVSGPQARSHVAVAEHGAAHLRAFVLQGEIPVPRSGQCQIRDLALHQHVGKVPFQQGLRHAVEAGDREHVTGRGRRRLQKV